MSSATFKINNEWAVAYFDYQNKQQLIIFWGGVGVGVDVRIDLAHQG